MHRPGENKARQESESSAAARQMAKLVFLDPFRFDLLALKRINADFLVQELTFSPAKFSIILWKTTYKFQLNKKTFIINDNFWPLKFYENLIIWY